METNTMKTFTVREARAKLAKLVEQAHDGAPVILVHGKRPVKLERYDLLDPEHDSDELEAELLKAVLGPHSAYSHSEMRAVADRALRAHRKR